ncbi:MAG: ABC transporter substrate-binding protein [Candidatus Thermoplasmatota archaeon]|nr:ABC transporter substrate-binding protein [Candidatus Thermoplasmatota archaeon]
MEHRQILFESREIPENPVRIVSLSPSVTEILYLLGMERSIVGISAFCARPPETSGKRKIGSYGFVRDEVMAELKPDVMFLMSGFQEKFFLENRDRYPIVMFELPESVAGVIDLVNRVGKAVSREDEARSLARELFRKMPEPAVTGLSGYIEIDLGGPVSFGRHSYITDALSMYGIETIYRNENMEWLTPEDSRILSEDPDVVIYEPKMYYNFREKDLQKLVTSRGWDTLSAWKTGNFHVTPGPLDFFAHHGPSFITEVLPWLAGIVSRKEE